MKILASDYDGTISLNDSVSADTIRAIYDWKDAGNLFALVTGRNLGMAKTAIEANNIPIDFLICNNGCVIFDNQYNEIKSSHLSGASVKALIHDEDIQRSEYIVLANMNGRYVYDNDYIEGKYPDLSYNGVLTKTDFSQANRFYQIDTLYESVTEMNLAATSLQRKFGEEVTVNPNLDTIDITPKGVTKLTGLQYYLNLNQLNEKDVITVGDGLNDIGMIHYFNGYAMDAAVESIKAGAKGVVASVEELISKELE